MNLKQKLNPSKERERIYKILELNDATNKASWWNIADEILNLLKDQREEMEKALRIPEWHTLDKSVQEILKVMTSYGAFTEIRKARNQAIDIYLKQND